MLDLGSLVGFLELDKSRWNNDLDGALRDVDDFGRKAKPRAEAAGKQAGQGAGEGFTKGADGRLRDGRGKFVKAGEEAGEAVGDGFLTKGKVKAAAAAAAFGIAFHEALDLGAGRDKLAAQLDASHQQAVRYGKAASNLYSGAWGESLDEVNTAIASVVTSLDGMDHVGRGRLEGLTAKALDFASAFDVDVTRAVQVAGTTVTSGLAKNLDEAFDLLFASSSKVPVQLREDLQDAVEEYGQFFDMLGYTGPEAFGMLVDASDKGMYGIDKMGDAIKEFSVLVATDLTRTKPVIKTLGLNYTETADALLKGGDDAKEATQKIIDGLLDIESPSKRARLAVELFGTPLEDLNVRDIPDFLRSMQGMSDTMDDTAGAADRMGQKLNDNASTKVKGFARTVKMDVVDFLANEVIPTLEDLADDPAVEGIADSFKDMGAELGPLIKDTLPVAADLLSDIAGFLGDAAPLAHDFVTAFNNLPDGVKKAAAGALALAAVAKAVPGKDALSGAAGLTRKALGKAAPIPVFVTNEGFGGPGGKARGAASKGGPLAALGKAGAMVSALVATGALFAHEKPLAGIKNPFGGVTSLPVPTTTVKEILPKVAGWLRDTFEDTHEVTEEAEKARRKFNHLHHDLTRNIKLAVDNTDIKTAQDEIRRLINLADTANSIDIRLQGAAGAHNRKLLGDSYPGMATGGTVLEEGLSWVGERGPELRWMPKGAKVMPLPSGSAGVVGGIDYDRLAALINQGRQAPLIGQQTVLARDMDDWRRQTDETHRMTALGGANFA